MQYMFKKGVNQVRGPAACWLHQPSAVLRTTVLFPKPIQPASNVSCAARYAYVDIFLLSSRAFFFAPPPVFKCVLKI